MEIFSLITFVLILSHCESGAEVEAPVVSLTPKSLMIPVNGKVVFTCTVIYDGCYSLAWYRSNSASNLVIAEPSPGFNILALSNNTHKLVFNATRELNVNNTNFSCAVISCSHSFSQPSISNKATLFILNATSAPIPRNPWLNESTSLFHLMWSPPFLWYGLNIDYFMVSITNINDGSIVLERINVSDNLSARSIESLYYVVNETCLQVQFEIRPYNDDSTIGDPCVISGNSPSDIDEFVPTLNVTVFFNAKSNAILLKTSVELPPICSYEEVTAEYSISFHDKSEGYFYRETINTTGPGSLTHDVNSAKLIPYKNYSLTVLVNAHGRNFTSQQMFDTYLHCGANTVGYQTKGSLLRIVLITVVAVLYVP